MKKKFSVLALISVCALQWSGCTTSRAVLDYKTLGEQNRIDITDGSVNGKSLGVAKGDDGGAIWADCTEKAEGSMRELIAQAKNRGGNAIGNIQWYATKDSEPSCKKGWGYLIIWPFVLTPLFMSTAVEAHVYHVDNARNSSGLIMLPKSHEEELKLVKKLVAGLH